MVTHRHPSFIRSKLFVPGSRPELFAKALVSDADAISIDLEDAVVEDKKSEARAHVGTWLAELARTPHSKTIIVRVNAMDTPHFLADLDAVVSAGLHIINLPKPQGADAVREASNAITKLEASQGLSPQSIGLLLNIETPAALADAAPLASADPRVMGLQVGLGDLFEPLGINRREPTAISNVLFAVRMAAGAAGVMALDGAFANVADSAGFQAEAELAQRLGFAGKSCIHPSQIALANAAFAPTAAQIAHAMRVIDALQASQDKGLGAFMVDGQMIDAPFIAGAKRILEIAAQTKTQMEKAK